MQQLQELVAQIDPTGLAQKGVDSIKAFRDSQNLATPGENPNPNPVDPNAPGTPLVNAPGNDKKTPGGSAKKEGESVTKAVGQANQVRNITIQIEAFNKGGINVAQSSYAGMSKDDVEAWFKEMLRRVVINAETA